MSSETKPKFDRELQARLVAEWIADLRKTGMRQVKHRLETANGRCCLGVLCRTFDRIVPDAIEIRVIEGTTEFDNDTSILPRTVMVACGVRDPAGRAYGGQGWSLTRKNDEGATFPEIADLIESEWNNRREGGLFLTDAELDATEAK